MSDLESFKRPKVSIIVTCYNLGRFIVDCVKSIESQTYKNFEIIIVNDCSVDDSKEIIDKNFKNSPIDKLLGKNKLKNDIKVIHLEENKGQFGAFLEGLMLADGQFVCMIDADDVLTSEFLAIHLQVHMKKSVALTSCAQFEIDENSTIHCMNSLATPEFDNGEYVEDKKPVDEIFNVSVKDFKVKTMDVKTHPFGTWNWNPTSSAMMRRSAVDYLLRYKNPADWRKGADKIVFSFLHLIGGSATISAPLMAYRRHGTNLSSANPVMGNFRYLKPDAIRLYVGYNKRIRQDVLKFIFGNYRFFCSQFNELNVKKMIWRVIFSFNKATIKRVFKSFFVK